MEDNPHTKTDRSEKILDALADYIESAPGEELLEDARREGRDPEQIASHVKGVIVKAVKDHQQQGAATRDPLNATISKDDADSRRRHIVSRRRSGGAPFGSNADAARD